VRNTPISEIAIVGAAVGAALAGARPIVEIMYCDWITLAMEGIVNLASKLRYIHGGAFSVPVVIRTTCGARIRSAACHSQTFEAWFIHVPGLKTVMPSTPYDAKGLLKASIRQDDPVIFFEHKLLYKQKGLVPEEDYTVPLGKADIKREGNDITIVAISIMVQEALNAAVELEKEGISVEVLDPRTLSPLDKEKIVDSVKKTGRVLVVEEGCKTGGVGAEISAVIMEEAFDYLDAPVQRLGNPDVPIPYSPKLEDFIIPNKNSIIQAVKKIVD
jgi:pyruvate dehydrogenase E1 component beta subunit